MHQLELGEERPSGGHAAPAEGARCGSRSRCSHPAEVKPGWQTHTPAVQTPAMLQLALVAQPDCAGSGAVAAAMSRRGGARRAIQAPKPGGLHPSAGN